jgi:hypothetical protein
MSGEKASFFNNLPKARRWAKPGGIEEKSLSISAI